MIAIYALFISAVVGVPLGILAATKVGSRIDAFVTGIASLGVALPSFWLAILLVIALSLNWHFFPATGARPFLVDPLGAIRHATLPAIALAVAVIAELARQVRSALIEVLNSQYVRTLHAEEPGTHRDPVEARPAQHQRGATDLVGLRVEPARCRARS